MHSGRQNGRPALPSALREKALPIPPRRPVAPDAARLSILCPEQTVAASIPEA